jgi:heme exporter protein C
LTGSSWGRPTWGVWWDWDPRLTATLVLLLVCLGYHLLRSFTPDLRARRVTSGIIAILAAINVPLVYYSVNIWRSLHQPQTFVRKTSNASADIGYVLLASSVALICLSVAIYKIRRQGIAASEMLALARSS